MDWFPKILLKSIFAFLQTTSPMKVLDLEFKPYIDRKTINSQVIKIAEAINRDYRDDNPLVLVILNGAFVFAADLYREIKIPSQISFVKLSSYLHVNSTGNVKELIGLNEKIMDRNLIIIEDIIDSGLTLRHMRKVLQDLGASSIEVASLFIKPESFHHEFGIKYVGFSIPNQFIIGYGLDYEGYGRNLPDIFVHK
jgi:hypoxanthine phosphoribosyltransferase